MAKTQEVYVEPGEVAVTIHHALDVVPPKLITIRWIEGEATYSAHVEGNVAEIFPLTRPDNGYVSLAELYDKLEREINYQHHKLGAEHGGAGEV